MPGFDALSHSEEETIARGRELAAQLRALVSPVVGAGLAPPNEGAASGAPTSAAAQIHDVGARHGVPAQGALVLLCGELGAGKTTFAKGIVSGLGAAREEDVLSPTFTLVHRFASHSSLATRHLLLVYHVDLYRIAGAHDLETLGLEDIFSEPAIVIVEWPERLTAGLAAGRADWPRIEVRLSHVDEHTRRIEITSP